MPLSVSTYKYIHFSHPASERSRTPRCEMLGGSESRLKRGRVVGVMPAITVLTEKGGEEKRKEREGVAHDWRDNGTRTEDWLCDQGL